MGLETFVFHKSLFAIGLCLLFYSIESEDNLPKNVVVMAGADKVLNCAEGEPFRWYRYLPSDPNNETVLFKGTRMADGIDKRYRVLKEPENFPFQRLDLIITDVQADHHGTYRCKLPQSSVCAELIVLASEPKCRAQRVTRDTEETKEMLEVMCNVNVTENGEPEMLLRYANDTTTRQTNCSARYNGTVTCVTYIPAQMQSEYTCTIKIKHKPIRGYPLVCKHVSNEPDFRYTWLPSSAVVPDSVKPICALLRSTESNEWTVENSLLFAGLPTLGVLVIILSVTVMFLICRSRKKKDPRYQKKISSPGSNEAPSSDYATLNISSYEEIPEGLYCTANPAVLATPYSEVTRA